MNEIPLMQLVMMVFAGGILLLALYSLVHLWVERIALKKKQRLQEKAPPKRTPRPPVRRGFD